MPNLKSINTKSDLAFGVPHECGAPLVRRKKINWVRREWGAARAA